MNEQDQEIIDLLAKTIKQIINNSKPDKMEETEDLLISLVSEYTAVCNQLRSKIKI